MDCYHLVRSLFCLFLSGCFTQVLHTDFTVLFFLFKAGMGVLVFLFFQQPHEVDMEVPGKGIICARGYTTFSCSTQLSMEFILLMNMKMPTIVGILTFISMINTTNLLET